MSEFAHGHVRTTGGSFTVVKKVVGSYWVYLHHIAVARGCLAVPTSGSLPESIQVVAGEKIQQIAQQQCVTIVFRGVFG